MKECSKSIMRRLGDPNFTSRYFRGKGLDIGGKPDPLSLYRSLFCMMDSVRTWDWEDGDAQYLASVEDGEFDFVHSSHCLEHLKDPVEGLQNWFRAVKPNGHLIVTVPDEDLYEQGIFPSTFNADHKSTFTIFKTQSWSPSSVNLLDLLRTLGGEAEVLKLEQLSSTYRFDLPRYDQTRTPVAECGIEFVIRKRPPDEVKAGGRWQRTEQQPDRETRVHLNQYRLDQQGFKLASTPPFTTDADI